MATQPDLVPDLIAYGFQALSSEAPLCETHGATAAEWRCKHLDDHGESSAHSKSTNRRSSFMSRRAHFTSCANPISPRTSSVWRATRMLSWIVRSMATSAALRRPALFSLAPVNCFLSVLPSSLVTGYAAHHLAAAAAFPARLRCLPTSRNHTGRSTSDGRATTNAHVANPARRE